MSGASRETPTKRYIRAARVVTAAQEAPSRTAPSPSRAPITAVGPAAQVTANVPAAAVEAYADATLLPGLVDAHAHLTLAGDRRTYEQMVLDPDEMMALVSVRNLQRHLACGVTTLRDNGGRNRVTFVVREAINRGYFVGPRLLLSGRPVTHRHGHFYWCNGVADGLDRSGPPCGSSSPRARTTSRSWRPAARPPGTSPTTPRTAPRSSGRRRDGARPRAAHDRPLPGEAVDDQRSTPGSTASSTGSSWWRAGRRVRRRRLLERRHGVRSARHRRLLRQDTFVSYTFQAGGYDSLVELRAKAGHERLTPGEATRRDALEAYYEMKLGVFSRLMGDGMLPLLVVSSDAGPFDCEFERMHYGMELAVQAGMSPLQAIEAATSIAARACGVAGLTGKVEPGKEADLLVVHGNPRPTSAHGRHRRGLQGRIEGRPAASQRPPALTDPVSL